jgi:hypothetical protein
MAITKVTLARLTCASDWDRWILVLKTYAHRHDMWKYIDPYRSAVTTTCQDAVEAIPTEPTKPDANITDPNVMLRFNDESRKYDNVKHLKSNIDSMINDSLSISLKRFLDGIFNTHEMLVILKDLLDKTRREAEYQRWRKDYAYFWKKREAAFQFRRKYDADRRRLAKGPGDQDLEKWAFQWLNLDSDVKRAISRGIRSRYDFTEPGLVENFLDVVKKITPIGYRLLLMRQSQIGEITLRLATDYFIFIHHQVEGRV